MLVARDKEKRQLCFALKYRPSEFSDLLGQDVLVKVLKQSVKSNKLANAYLLSGVRGVGKTSSARIIAKIINCTNLDPNNIVSCGSCANCASVLAQNHPDIIEMDAASKTGIDDIKSIIESAEYKPLLGKYKIFIIDEIHMLSKSAFNALLKLIEEPPSHVIFIFATTEIQKIPLTIISRCQRYDLRRLNIGEICTLLKSIATQEKVNISDDALKIVAEKADGSARDAISILDQLVSYAGCYEDQSNIDSNVVNNMLGILDTGEILNMLKLIISNAPKDALDSLSLFYTKVSDIKSVIISLVDLVAFMIKMKVISDHKNILYDAYISEIKKFLIGVSLSRLTVLWQILNNGIEELKNTHNQLIATEMLVIRSIYSFNLPALEELVDDNDEPHGKNLSTDNMMNNKFGEIFSFLKYCYNEGFMDIYYMLLNEVEVIKFSDNMFEISNKNGGAIDTKIVEKLLYSWSNTHWNIKVTFQDKIISIKEIMLKKASEHEDYQIIKKYFPNANISDIIMND